MTFVSKTGWISEFKYFKSKVSNNKYSTSEQEAIAIFKYLANSFSELEPQPSAKFVGIEETALLN